MFVVNFLLIFENITTHLSYSLNFHQRNFPAYNPNSNKAPNYFHMAFNNNNKKLRETKNHNSQTPDTIP